MPVILRSNCLYFMTGTERRTKLKDLNDRYSQDCIIYFNSSEIQDGGLNDIS